VGADAAHMVAELRQAACARGFTMLEMLIAMIMIAILVGIAVPAYLKFRDRGNGAAAQANIRAMIPAVETYKADNDSAYTGMTIGGTAGLRAVYDDALKDWNAALGTGVTILSTSADTYCIKSVSGGVTYYKEGPGAAIVQAPACT
jgi:prepilin-type N-terminal cleavage/methylation domain-containing protein